MKFYDKKALSHSTKKNTIIPSVRQHLLSGEKMLKNILMLNENLIWKLSATEWVFLFVFAAHPTRSFTSLCMHREREKSFQTFSIELVLVLKHFKVLRVHMLGGGFYEIFMCNHHHRQ